MDVKRINDFVRNLDSAINITGITVYGVDDEGHSVKIDTEMLTNPKPTFTEASTRTNIVGSGESTTTLWGKVKKFFTDLKTVAFSGNYNDLNNTPEIKTVATTGVFSDLIDKNVSTGTVAFTEASSRTNIATGESQSTMWGKVKKWFTDLKAVAFSGSYNDLSDKLQNATTAAAGLLSSENFVKLSCLQRLLYNQTVSNFTVNTYYSAFRIRTSGAVNAHIFACGGYNSTPWGSYSVNFAGHYAVGISGVQVGAKSGNITKCAMALLKNGDYYDYYFMIKRSDNSKSSNMIFVEAIGLGDNAYIEDLQYAEFTTPFSSTIQYKEITF